MAVDAGSGFENVATVGYGVGGLRRAFLCGYPGIKLFGGLDINTQEHFGVLDSAVLRTLTDVHSGGMWIDPNGVDAIGNEVGFSG